MAETQTKEGGTDKIHPPDRPATTETGSSDGLYTQLSLAGKVFIMRKYPLPQAQKAIWVNQAIYNQTHFCWTGRYRLCGFLLRLETLRTVH